MRMPHGRPSHLASAYSSFEYNLRASVFSDRNMVLAFAFLNLPLISPFLGLTVFFPMASTPVRKTSPEDSDSTDSITLGTAIHERQNVFKQAEPEIKNVREHTDAVTDEKVAFLDTFSPEEEKSIMRKVDWRILPLIGLMQFVKSVSTEAPSGILRADSSYRSTLPMPQVWKWCRWGSRGTFWRNFTWPLINTTGYRLYTMWVVAFYLAAQHSLEIRNANLDKIAYIIFELPSNVLLKHMSPRIFQTRIILSWGLVLACHAAVKNKEGIYTVRFFLGVMEAGLFPGLITHICSW